MIWVTADLHVKRRLWNNCTKIEGDTYKALEKAAAMLPDQNQVLIDCGDALDVVRPKAEDVAAVSQFFSKFRKVYVVDGNHDKAEPSWTDLLRCSNVVHLSEDPVIEGGFALFGMNFTPDKEKLLDFLQTVSERQVPGKRTVIVLHQGFKEFISFGGAFELTKEDVFSLFDEVTVLVGHVHIHSGVSDGEKLIISPGPIVPQDLDQARHIQYFSELLPNGTLKAYPIKVRKFIFTEKLEELPEPEKDMLPPAVIVQLEPAQPIPAVSKDLQEKYVFIWKRAIAEVCDSDTEISRAQTLEEAIQEEIQQTEPVYGQKIAALIRHLMNSDDPVQFLEEVITKWKAVRS